MNPQINDQFKPLYTTDARYVLVTGGRGSAKSFSVAVFAILLSFAKKMRTLVTRWTLTSAELSIIPEYNEKLTVLKTGGNFYSTKDKIVNIRTGSDILFKGIKTSAGIQTASLKSLAGVNTWIVDEAEELVDETIFDKIDLSIRVKGQRNLIILILNPTTRLHWIWLRWFKKHHKIVMVDGFPVAMSTHPDVCHIHLTYLDNIENLSTSFLKTITDMKITNRFRYGNEVIGGWKIDLDGVLYKQAELKRYRKKDLKLFDIINDEVVPLYESCLGYMDIADEGTDAFAFPVAHIFEGKVFITDIMYTKENTEVTLPLSAQMFLKHNMDRVRVESNNQGSMFIKALRELIPKQKVLPVHSHQKKHTRIILAEAFIKEYFHFLSDEDIIPGSPYDLFMQELFNYMRKEGETKDEDDAPDALSGLAKFIESFLHHLFKPKKKNGEEIPEEEK